MKKISIILIAVLAIGTLGVYAADTSDDNVYFAADNAPAVWVKNTGNEKTTIAVAGDSGTITVTIGSTANTIDASGTTVDDIAELIAAIAACTNSSGKTVLEAFSCGAVTTEAIDDELMVNTATIYAGGSGAGVLWDTSDTKHYRVFIPSSAMGSRRGAIRIKSAYGDVKGTGNVTIKAYTLENNSATEKLMYEIVSPAYVLAATATGNTAQATAVDSIGPGVVSDLCIDVIVGMNQAFLLSCDRATTGTTGGVGVRVEKL